MRPSTIIGSQSILWFIIAVPLVAWPEGLLGIFGPELTPLGYVVARIFGAELIGLALASWFTRQPPAYLVELVGADRLGLQSIRAVERGLFGAYVTSNSLGFLASLRGTLSGTLNSRGWLLVALYLIYALLFAYFLWRSSPNPTTEAD